MDPFLAVKEAVKKADGSLFMERVIRVDSVGEKTQLGEGDIGSFGDTDPKCTLFVGNLEFTSEEGDLRVFFETLMQTERGDPPLQETDGESTEKKPHTWVKRVRIIKDKETQLGKGFAYVQFIVSLPFISFSFTEHLLQDRECVDTLLTFSPDQLKFAKRKLRINRCKTIQGNKLSSAIKSKLSQPSTSSSSKDLKSDSKRPSQSKKPPRTATETIEIPKGDPALGTKLAHLSKEQRKQVKALDADRVARRLAKKKARMVMGTVDSSVGGGERKHRRERVRKATTTTTGGVVKKKRQDLVSKKKGRVRSEKSLEKRNMKK
jgi:nucleolar protein 12